MVCVTRTPYAMNIVAPVTIVTTCMALEGEAFVDFFRGLAGFVLCCLPCSVAR